MSGRLYRTLAYLAVSTMFGVALYWSHNAVGQTKAQAAQAKHLAAQGKQAHDALCVFEHDLSARIEQTSAYLATHPEKTILGVPRAVLVTNANNQQKTLDSLKSLGCPT